MKRMNDDFNSADRRPLGLTVPEHFFEDFRAEMEQKIDAYEAQRAASPATRRHLNLRRRWFLWTSVAACLGLLIGLASPVRLTPSASTPVATTDEYADADLSESQDQLEQDVMLASLSDYDIFEYYYYDEE